jgi:hypothetical protein
MQAYNIFVNCDFMRDIRGNKKFSKKCGVLFFENCFVLCIEKSFFFFFKGFHLIDNLVKYSDR